MATGWPECGWVSYLPDMTQGLSRSIVRSSRVRTLNKLGRIYLEEEHCDTGRWDISPGDLVMVETNVRLWEKEKITSGLIHPITTKTQASLAQSSRFHFGPRCQDYFFSIEKNKNKELGISMSLVYVSKMNSCWNVQTNTRMLESNEWDFLKFRDDDLLVEMSGLRRKVPPTGKRYPLSVDRSILDNFSSLPVIGLVGVLLESVPIPKSTPPVITRDLPTDYYHKILFFGGRSPIWVESSVIIKCDSDPKQSFYYEFDK